MSPFLDNHTICNAIEHSKANVWRYLAQKARLRGLRNHDPKVSLEVRDPRHRRWEYLQAAEDPYRLASARSEGAVLSLFDWADSNPDVVVQKQITKERTVRGRLGDVPHVNYYAGEFVNAGGGIDQFEAVIREGKWYRHDGSPVDTSMSPGKAGLPGYGVIVIHTNRKIYVHDYVEGHMHHTSTSGGAFVLCAGMVKVVAGRPVGFTLVSGHYQPRMQQLYRFIVEVKGKMDISKMRLEAPFINKNDMQHVLVALGSKRHRPAEEDFDFVFPEHWKC